MADRLAGTHATDLALVLPPSCESFYLPEMALPRLTGVLRAEGRTVHQDDWNARYWEAFLFQDEPFRRFVDRLRARPAPATEGPWRPVLDLYRTFLSGPELDLPACRRFVHRNRKEIFTWLYEQTRLTDARVSTIDRLVRTPDALLDPFLAGRVRALAADVAPRLLGLSIISVQQVPQALKTALYWKRARPDVPVVVGGPWVKVGRPFFQDPRYRFLFDAFDFVVTGDGEDPLAGLLAYLDGQRELASIANLFYRGDDGTIQATPTAPSRALATLPAPDFDGLPLALYRERMLPVERASLCYWRKCTFCWHNHADRTWSILPPDEVVARIRRWVAATGFTRFAFIDNAVDEDYTRRLATLLRAEVPGLRWFMQARLNREFTDPAYVRLLHEAGCRTVWFGLETVRPDRLKAYRKGIDVRIVGDILRTCAAQGIETGVYLLVYPGIACDELDETFRFCLEHREHLGPVIVQRFMLNANCAAFEHPNLLGITPVANDDPTLDFYNLPYEATGLVSDPDALQARIDDFFRTLRGLPNP